MPPADFAIFHTPHSPESDRAAWIAQELQNAGFSVYMDGDRPAGLVRPGDNALLVVNDLLSHASHVLVLISKGSRQTSGSTYVELAAMGFPVVPVLVEEFQVDGFLASHWQVRLFGLNVEADRALLMRNASTLKTPRSRPARDEPYPGRRT